MRMIDIITDKKFQSELTSEQINYFVNGVNDFSIPDYQISALLMAICLNGMNQQETFAFTQALADSGAKIDLSSIRGTVVDKHSSGGVGDKCTLIVGPIVSSFGVPFVKLSGRGLGFTGGTKDKLESIREYRTNYSQEEFIRLANRTGIVISGQSKTLAPADKRLYEIRDVTATTDSIPLIAASIMSKKIASGAKHLILDIKCGNGAFMNDLLEAQRLATLMIAIASNAGIHTKVFITDMNQPLGQTIGNALEVKEAYDTLSGYGPNDLTEICVNLAAGMLELAGKGDFAECTKMAHESLKDGSALVMFRKLIQSQGGALDPSGLPIMESNVSNIVTITSDKEGFVSRLSARDIGITSVLLGAGREKKEDLIDYGAGIVLTKKISDHVNKGDAIAVIYTNKSQIIEFATDKIKKAYTFSLDPQPKQPLILSVIH